MQFLLEAIILTLTGGVIGVIVGVGASLLITKVMNLPAVISYSSIGLALGVSSVVGIVFGWYPAQKASKLAPIEALRYE